MAITDLTNTTWVLKPSLVTYPGGTYTKKQYNVNITTSEAIDPITPASGYDPKTNFTYISIGYNSGGEYNEIGLDQNNFPYYQIAHGNDTKTLPDTWSSYYQGNFTITGGTDATNSTLISWLETNATQQIIDISITYEDTEIATMSESGTKTLKTGGKYCTDDITIEYTKHEIAPNLQVKTNIAPTTSSQTITADSGYDGLSSVQINAMPNGTAGTPTATKGTVSNHSISVTPSVTNTTGYITGGTKTGTAVTVSASELVSGTLSITSSGTKDVTNYASASVSAGSVTSPNTISGTSATVSTGTNTLTLSKTVSVTPSVTTAGYISTGTAGNASVSLTANVTTKGATTYGLSTSDVTIASGTYLTGAQTIKGITGGTYTATSNVSGVDIKNYSSLTVAVPGPNVSSLTVTPSGSTQTFDGSDVLIYTIPVNIVLSPDQDRRTRHSSNFFNDVTLVEGQTYTVSGYVYSGSNSATISGTWTFEYVGTSSTSGLPYTNGFPTTSKVGITWVGFEYSSYWNSIALVVYYSSANASNTYVGTAINFSGDVDGYLPVTVEAMTSGSATTPATTITSNPSVSINTSTGVVTANVSGSSSITPTVSAGYVSTGTAGTVNVSGSNTLGLTTIGATTITPTESEQTAVAASRFTTGIVKVAGITSTYVGSGVTGRTAGDLSASGKTVTVPVGYYASQVTKDVSTMTLPTTTSGTSSGTNKASISQGATDKYINIPTGYNENAANYLIPAYTAQTLPNSTSGTSSGTSKATITPSTSVQYLNIPTGYQATAQYYTVSGITTMTLPSSTSGTSSGTSKATLTPSTSVQYLNIPTGYNSSAQYYTISGITTMTLPTAASGTSSGTNKATIGRSTSDQYINIPTGYNSSAANYKISAVANGSATTPTKTITPSITRVIDSPTGVVSISVSGSSSITPTISAGYVSAGTAGTVSVSGSTTLSLTTQAAQTITPTTTDQTIDRYKWLTGVQTIKGDANLVAENIKNGVTIFGVTGTLSGGGTEPVGSVLCMSANSNPENLGYEGTWTLIDKEFASFYGVNGTTTGTSTTDFFQPFTGFTLQNNDYIETQPNNGVTVTRTDHLITIHLRIRNTNALSDTNVIMGQFNLANLGISSFSDNQYILAWSESGNGVIMAQLYNSEYSTKSGQLEFDDFVVKAAATTFAADKEILFTFTINLPYTSMLDSKCNKFYFEKTAGGSDYINADATAY